MPALSDQVAVTALVVSLVALIIAVGQWVQQWFFTAEGYRRCAESVMGPWSKLRHRRRNFSELRLEVEYETPHIAIVSDQQNADMLLGPVAKLADVPYQEFNLKEKVLAALRATVEPERTTTESSWINTSYGTQMRKTFRSQRIDDPEKSTSASQMQSDAAAVASLRARSELHVTWLLLLKVLYTTYRDLGIRSESNQGNSVYSDTAATDRGASRNNSGSDVTSKMGHSEDGELRGRTNVVVASRTWNWDFMPPDLLRPLATSALNDIVLLALRLNMQWRTLDVEKGVFLADGNGYSLSSTDLRGLGTVFTFRENGLHNPDCQFVPSAEADKLMFGIIPGKSNELVGQNYSLINMDRKMDGSPPRSLLTAIGITNKDLQNQMINKAWQEPHNEIILLLCPFLPLKNSPILFHYTPLWTANPITTPLHYVEGRFAFVEALEDRLEQETNPKLHDLLKQIFNRFNSLKEKHHDDFFDLWFESKIESKFSTPNEKVALSDACREIFDWTSDFFGSQRCCSLTDAAQNTGQPLGQHDSVPVASSDSGPTGASSPGAIQPNQQPDAPNAAKAADYASDGRTYYVHLVAAHAILSFHAVSHVVAHQDHSAAPSEARKQHHRAIFSYDTRTLSAHIQYRIAREYVHCLKDKTFGVASHMRSKGIDWDEGDFEVGWWMLVLRGIVWDMSTMGDRNFGRGWGQWEGEAVPSAFYDMKTPVWIT
ncbi:MAG: hypothetical protein Q9160_007287 [Pyrenula sp. 1 TL-2023]